MTQELPPPVDAMFLGAHPDDVEIFAGGLVASMARAGHRVLIVDATRGEMGTRGTVEERAVEAGEAARILGAIRGNLGLPDGRLAADQEATTSAVVRAIRMYRPRLLFTHSFADHHPDHDSLARAVRHGAFLSTVAKYEADLPRHQPARVFHGWGHRSVPPPPLAFVSDITDTFETKLEALRAHRSQFHGTGYSGPATFVASEAFWTSIRTRAAYFGSLVGVAYGEPFLSEATLRIDDPITAFGEFPAR